MKKVTSLINQIPPNSIVKYIYRGSYYTQLFVRQFESMNQGLIYVFRELNPIEYERPVAFLKIVKCKPLISVDENDSDKASRELIDHLVLSSKPKKG